MSDNIFINFLIVIFNLFKYIILPIIIIFLILISFSIAIQYLKYGKSVSKSFFSSFKRKDTKGARDKILYYTLEKISVPKRLLKLSYLKSNYCLVTQSGIYIIYLFLNEGIIVGKEDDKYLRYSLESVHDRPIYNPFVKLNDDYKKIKKLLPDSNVYKYLVTLSNEYINVKTDTEIMKYNDILYKLPLDDIMSVEQMNEYADILEKADVK